MTRTQTTQDERQTKAMEIADHLRKVLMNRAQDAGEVDPCLSIKQVRDLERALHYTDLGEIDRLNRQVEHLSDHNDTLRAQVRDLREGTDPQLRDAHEGLIKAFASVQSERDRYLEQLRPIWARDEMAEVFSALGLRLDEVDEIENRYWPDSYEEERKNNPWRKVKLAGGVVLTVGRRKRVISIKVDSEVTFDPTKLRKLAERDGTTYYADEYWKSGAEEAKTVTIHAWNAEKAREYLEAVNSISLSLEV